MKKQPTNLIPIEISEKPSLDTIKAMAYNLHQVKDCHVAIDYISRIYKDDHQEDYFSIVIDYLSKVMLSWEELLQIYLDNMTE